MISELKKEDLNLLNNTFINKEYLENEFNNNPFIKVLILKEDKIIGYLHYSDIYDRVEINQIEIEETKRNCGKGSLLLKKLTDTVDKSITLEVRESNIAAINFYKKNGFKISTIRKNYYGNENGYLMLNMMNTCGLHLQIL